MSQMFGMMLLLTEKLKINECNECVMMFYVKFPLLDFDQLQHKLNDWYDISTIVSSVYANCIILNASVHQESIYYLSSQHRLTMSYSNPSAIHPT